MRGLPGPSPQLTSWMKENDMHDNECWVCAKEIKETPYVISAGSLTWKFHEGCVKGEEVLHLRWEEGRLMLSF